MASCLTGTVFVPPVQDCVGSVIVPGKQLFKKRICFFFPGFVYQNVPTSTSCLQSQQVYMCTSNLPASSAPVSVLIGVCLLIHRHLVMIIACVHYPLIYFTFKILYRCVWPPTWCNSSYRGGLVPS